MIKNYLFYTNAKKVDKQAFLTTNSVADFATFHNFAFSINGAYAIYDNQLLAWIPHSQNLYEDNLEYLSCPPISFSNFGPKKIVKISCNTEVVHAITEDAIVFSWGNDSKAQGLLALGDIFTVKSPTHNKHLSTIHSIDISLSENHGAAIDSCRNLFTWGNGSMGQLGNKKIKSALIPRKVLLNVPFNVKKVECGNNYTCGITIDKIVFYFGRIQPSYYSTTTMINDIPMPMTESTIDRKDITFIPLNHEAEDIYCGEKLFAITSSMGGLFIYIEDQGLYRVKIPHKINKVKFISDNFYAINPSNDILYEFINYSTAKRVNHSSCTNNDVLANMLGSSQLDLHEYVENSYKVNNKAKLKMLQSPFYVKVLFFTLCCSIEEKEKYAHNHSNIFIKNRHQGSHQGNDITLLNDSKANNEYNNSITLLLNKTNSSNRSRVSKISTILGNIFERKIETIRNANKSIYNINNSKEEKTNLFMYGKKRIEVVKVDNEVIDNESMLIDPINMLKKKQMQLNKDKDISIHLGKSIEAEYNDDYPSNIIYFLDTLPIEIDMKSGNQQFSLNLNDTQSANLFDTLINPSAKRQNNHAYSDGDNFNNLITNKSGNRFRKQNHASNSYTKDYNDDNKNEPITEDKSNKKRESNSFGGKEKKRVPFSTINYKDNDSLEMTNEQQQPEQDKSLRNSKALALNENDNQRNEPNNDINALQSKIESMIIKQKEKNKNKPIIPLSDNVSKGNNLTVMRYDNKGNKDKSLNIIENKEAVWSGKDDLNFDIHDAIKEKELVNDKGDTNFKHLQKNDVLKEKVLQAYSSKDNGMKGSINENNIFDDSKRIMKVDEISLDEDKLSSRSNNKVLIDKQNSKKNETIVTPQENSKKCKTPPEIKIIKKESNKYKRPCEIQKEIENQQQQQIIFNEKNKSNALKSKPNSQKKQSDKNDLNNSYSNNNNNNNQCNFLIITSKVLLNGDDLSSLNTQQVLKNNLNTPKSSINNSEIKSNEEINKISTTQNQKNDSVDLVNDKGINTHFNMKEINNSNEFMLKQKDQRKEPEKINDSNRINNIIQVNDNDVLRNGMNIINQNDNNCNYSNDAADSLNSQVKLHNNIIIENNKKDLTANSLYAIKGINNKNTFTDNTKVIITEESIVDTLIKRNNNDKTGNKQSIIDSNTHDNENIDRNDYSSTNILLTLSELNQQDKNNQNQINKPTTSTNQTYTNDKLSQNITDNPIKELDKKDNHIGNNNMNRQLIKKDISNNSLEKEYKNQGENEEEIKSKRESSLILSSVNKKINSKESDINQSNGHANDLIENNYNSNDTLDKNNSQSNTNTNVFNNTNNQQFDLMNKEDSLNDNVLLQVKSTTSQSIIENNNIHSVNYQNRKEHQETIGNNLTGNANDVFNKKNNESSSQKEEENATSTDCIQLPKQIHDIRIHHQSKDNEENAMYDNNSTNLNHIHNMKSQEKVNIIKNNDNDSKNLKETSINSLSENNENGNAKDQLTNKDTNLNINCKAIKSNLLRNDQQSHSLIHQEQNNSFDNNDIHINSNDNILLSNKDNTKIPGKTIESISNYEQINDTKPLSEIVNKGNCASNDDDNKCNTMNTNLKSIKGKENELNNEGFYMIKDNTDIMSTVKLKGNPINDEEKEEIALIGNSNDNTKRQSNINENLVQSKITFDKKNQKDLHINQMATNQDCFNEVHVNKNFINKRSQSKLKENQLNNEEKEKSIWIKNRSKTMMSQSTLEENNKLNKNLIENQTIIDKINQNVSETKELNQNQNLLITDKNKDNQFNKDKKEEISLIENNKKCQSKRDGNKQNNINENLIQNKALTDRINTNDSNANQLHQGQYNQNAFKVIFNKDKNQQNMINNTQSETDNSNHIMNLQNEDADQYSNDNKLLLNNKALSNKISKETIKENQSQMEQTYILKGISNCTHQNNFYSNDLEMTTTNVIEEAIKRKELLNNNSINEESTYHSKGTANIIIKGNINLKQLNTNNDKGHMTLADLDSNVYDLNDNHYYKKTEVNSQDGLINKKQKSSNIIINKNSSSIHSTAIIDNNEEHQQDDDNNNILSQKQQNDVKESKDIRNNDNKDYFPKNNQLNHQNKNIDQASKDEATLRNKLINSALKDNSVAILINQPNTKTDPKNIHQHSNLINNDPQTLFFDSESPINKRPIKKENKINKQHSHKQKHNMNQDFHTTDTKENISYTIPKNLSHNSLMNSTDSDQINYLIAEIKETNQPIALSSNTIKSHHSSIKNIHTNLINPKTQSHTKSYEDKIKETDDPNSKAQYHHHLINQKPIKKFKQNNIDINSTNNNNESKTSRQYKYKSKEEKNIKSKPNALSNLINNSNNEGSNSNTIINHTDKNEAFTMNMNMKNKLPDAVVSLYQTESSTKTVYNSNNNNKNNDNNQLLQQKMIYQEKQDGTNKIKKILITSESQNYNDNQILKTNENDKKIPLHEGNNNNQPTSTINSIQNTKYKTSCYSINNRKEMPAIGDSKSVKILHSKGKERNKNELRKENNAKTLSVSLNDQNEKDDKERDNRYIISNEDEDNYDSNCHNNNNNNNEQYNLHDDTKNRKTSYQNYQNNSSYSTNNKETKGRNDKTKSNQAISKDHHNSSDYYFTLGDNDANNNNNNYDSNNNNQYINKGKEIITHKKENPLSNESSKSNNEDKNNNSQSDQEDKSNEESKDIINNNQNTNKTSSDQATISTIAKNKTKQSLKKKEQLNIATKDDQLPMEHKMISSSNFMQHIKKIDDSSSKKTEFIPKELESISLSKDTSLFNSGQYIKSSIAISNENSNMKENHKGQSSLKGQQQQMKLEDLCKSEEINNPEGGACGSNDNDQYRIATNKTQELTESMRAKHSSNIHAISNPNSDDANRSSIRQHELIRLKNKGELLSILQNNDYREEESVYYLIEGEENLSNIQEEEEGHEYSPKKNSQIIKVKNKKLISVRQGDEIQLIQQQQQQHSHTNANNNEQERDDLKKKKIINESLINSNPKLNYKKRNSTQEQQQFSSNISTNNKCSTYNPHNNKKKTDTNNQSIEDNIASNSNESDQFIKTKSSHFFNVGNKKQKTKNNVFEISHTLPPVQDTMSQPHLTKLSQMSHLMNPDISGNNNNKETTSETMRHFNSQTRLKNSKKTMSSAVNTHRNKRLNLIDKVKKQYSTNSEKDKEKEYNPTLFKTMGNVQSLLSSQKQQHQQQHLHTTNYLQTQMLPSSTSSKTSNINNINSNNNINNNNNTINSNRKKTNNFNQNRANNTLQSPKSTQKITSSHHKQFNLMPPNSKETTSGGKGKINYTAHSSNHQTPSFGNNRQKSYTKSIQPFDYTNNNSTSNNQFDSRMTQVKEEEDIAFDAIKEKYIDFLEKIGKKSSFIDNGTVDEVFLRNLAKNQVPIEENNFDSIQCSTDMRQFIIHSLENFKLKQVKEKLDFMREKAQNSNNIELTKSNLLGLIEIDYEDELKDKSSMFEPMELDKSWISLNFRKSFVESMKSSSNDIFQDHTYLRTVKAVNVQLFHNDQSKK